MGTPAQIIPLPDIGDAPCLEEIHCSTRTIAGLLDLSQRRVQQLVNEGHIPRVCQGQFRLVPVVRGYIGYLRDNTTSSGLGSEKRRLLAARADLAELVVARRVGDLIPVQTVELEWSAIVVNFRNQMLALAARAAPLVVAAKDVHEAHSIIESLILQALEELSKVEN